jgi:hypothetical protein
LTTGNSHFASSGSSPPVDFSGVPSLPPELVEALAELLAEAIVADIRQFPNLAELCANQESTVESPSGHDRTDPPVRRQRTRQEHAAADRHSGAGPSDRRPPPRQSRGRPPEKIGHPREALEVRSLPAKKFTS